MAAAVILCISLGLQNKSNNLTKCTAVISASSLQPQFWGVLEQEGTCRPRKTRPNFVFLHFLETQHYANYQKLRFCKEGSAKHTNICSFFAHGAPQSADRMALYTPGYTGIKQGLLLQAPHRIPNTMEPRTSGLAVTSFLEGTLFLWCISFQTYRHWASMVSSAIGQTLQHQCLYRPVYVCVHVCVPSRTYSQDKVVVRLVVDGIQDVKHLDGKIWHRA